MKILPLNSVNFKSHFGYDDSISQERRNYIREHLNNEYNLNSNDIFIKNGRLEEYKYNQLLKSLGFNKKTRKQEKINVINDEIMENLPLWNVEPIYGINSYKGSTSGLNDDICNQLKQAGIKRVVSFLEHGKDKVKTCKRNGLEVLWYPVSFGFWFQDMFEKEEDIHRSAKKAYDVLNGKRSFEEILNSKLENWNKRKEEQTDKFVEFIQFMQKENVYAGCTFARGRTDNVLMLNHFFNPKASKTIYCLSYGDDIYFEKMMNLYKNLTPEQKIKMGWDEEFDNKFLQKMQKLIALSKHDNR